MKGTGAKAALSVKALTGALVGTVAVAGVLGVMLLQKPAAPAANSDAGSPLTIGYAEGAVVLDEDSLQKAVDDMYNKTAAGRIALEYKNDAISSDGQTFACYINNAPSNTHDEFIGIYADAQYTDELFLSELIRPGTGFESVTLNRALDVGTNRVYVVYTQVSEKDGEQVMVGQTAVTMDFIVKE